MAHIQEITGKDFDDKVLKAEGKILVDFFAPWCGPCQMIGPILEEISDEIKGEDRIFKVNVDENADLAGQYGVMSIPTMFIFENGKITDQMIGVVPKEELTKKLS